jgi:hypothetical protein
MTVPTDRLGGKTLAYLLGEIKFIYTFKILFFIDLKRFIVSLKL